MSLLALALFACDPGMDVPEATDSEDTGVSGDTDTDAPDSGTQETDETADSEETGDSPVDTDADDDGWPTGEDCDDTLPNVYPGAPEGCDGLDQDCDGEPIPEGSCGDDLVLAVSATGHVLGDAASAEVDFPMPLPGAAGDGRALLGWKGGGGSDAVYWAAYEPGGGGLPMSSAVWVGWTGSHDTEYVSAGVTTADSDADGSADVWQCTSVREAGRPAAYVIYTPLPDTVPGATPIDELADATLYAGEFDRYDATSCAAGHGDADGDGFDDVLVAAGDADLATLHVVFGRPERFAGEVRLETDRGYVVVPGDADPSVTSQAWAGDLDGDGMDEVVARYNAAGARFESLGVISGADLVASAGAQPADVAVTWTRSPDGYTGSGLSPQGDEAEGQHTDLDGDGYGELVVSEWLKIDPSEYVDICTTFLQPHTLAPGDVEDFALTRLCYSPEPAEEYVGAAVLSAMYVYPSGQALLAVEVSPDRGGGTTDELCLYRTEDLPIGGRGDVGSLRGFCHPYQVINELADLTGDGLPEWILNDAEDPNDGGHLSVVEGFEIPWDDDSRW